jgi:arylsulfatase A-like enzyme
MKKKPNILLIMIDCLRSDRSVGNKASAQTPNMRRLIDQGTLFPNLITVNSMTTPCMTSVFSGLYPHTHGVRALSYARISDAVPLMAEILRDNGYHTVGAATGPVGPYTHLDRGFVDYEHREGVGKSLLNEWGDAFIARFQNKDLPEPWFAYLHLWEVHMPRQVLPAYDSPEYGRTKYDRAISSVDARLGELFAALDDHTLVFLSGDHGEKTADSGLESGIERLKSPVTHFFRRKLGGRPKKMYRELVGMVRSLWFSVARTMYRGGIIDNPLSSITGHGFHVYDSLVRVPLIISGHNPAKAGAIIDEQIRQIDILPTILDLAGLQHIIPEDIDGRIVSPLVEGQQLSPLPAIIETCQNPSEPSDLYGVRTQEWKYAVHISDPTVPEELYYLPDDPGEVNNLAASRPEITKELKAVLAAHLQSEQREGVSLADELSQDEMSDLAKHLEKLGYIE